MAEESKQTKIPRFESGTLSSVETRIPKPGGFTRPSIGISKLVRPQVNGISSKNRTSFKPEANPIISEEIPSNSFPRKTLLHRFGVANKVQIKTIPRLRNTNPQRTSQLLPSQNNVRVINETIEFTKGTAMNITKPVIESEKNNDAIMDRTLIRSNTFVCDDTQAKLSITHNIPMTSVPSSSQQNDTKNQTNLQLNKERTFKRSLSPIPGESMNSAKRKLMQMSPSSTSSAGQKVVSVQHMMPMNSTPRRSITYSDARKSNLTFFGAKSVDFSESQVDQLQTFTFDNTTYEKSNHFAPDATKLGTVTNATMHSNNRVFNLTQTVEQNDAFYPETKNCNVTLTLDSNAAEHELKNEDKNKPNITTTICTNDTDGNLTKNIIVEKTQPIQIVGSGALSEDLSVAKKRFSLGLELPECTLDCSIELCDSSTATSAQDSSPLVNYNPNSYDMEESLGILTPDQMIEFLDTNATNMRIELPSSLPAKIEPHKYRIDQTPSPEDLPLDTIEVKTIDSSKIEDADITLQPSSIACDNDVPSQTDSYSKTDQMTKSTTSKVTNSFITSFTSIASLDNGYHADGEMSRPASRGAESPMRRVHNARQNKLYATHDTNVPVVCRRQDPMTDSDFFTESDADVDIFHRGDRRVQIIDGHMYNAKGADIFIDEAPPENEMESSGVYTDVEHRDDVPSNSNLQNENESDVSPDGSTDTIKSSEYANNNESKKLMPKTDAENNKKQMQRQPWATLPIQSNQSIAAMSNSSSTTINDSVRSCLCEKPNIDDCGGDHAQLAISEASSSSLSNNNENTPCKLHSIICSDNDNSNSRTAAPQFKSSTPKVKRFIPNRKQCKSDTGSGHSKRNESVGKRESKSVGVKNRSILVSGSKKSTSILSSPGLKSPIENGQNSYCENANTINMTSDHQSPIALHVRKTVPNRWDAVMNKIALNKAEVKTVKYSEVKSKVTCGLKRTSPNSKTTTNEQRSTTSDSGNSSLISTKSSASPTVTRQSSHGIAKRSIERDSSKDSHLSFSRDSAVVTPGKQSKPTTSSARSSARKRSSIQNGFSPSDIKTETTAKTDPSAAKSVTLHKRFPANNNLQTTSSSPVSEKRAAITASKKSSSASKHVNQTSTPPVENKTSHAKEHGIQSPPAHSSTINNNNSSISNNNHNTKSGTNSLKLATNDEHHQQPLIATIHRNGKSSAATVIANKAVVVPQINTKSTGKSASRTTVNGELNENLIEFSIVDSTDGDATGCYASTTVSPTITDKTTTQKSFQQQKQQTAADLNVTNANKTIVALSILIQHLTTNSNAFGTPSLRVALETAKDKLLESQHNLETMRTKCTYLGEQMVAKEKFYTTLKETNERELDKIKLSLRETEKSGQEQIRLLQYELVKVNQQNIDALKSCQMKADRKCSELETQLQLVRDRELELVERLNSFTVTENQLRDKVQASEQEFSERLIAATARERELNEKVAHLTRQLKISDDKRFELEEKVKLACDETNELRHRRNSGEHSISNGNTSVQNQSSSSAMLEEEVLSLRSVLDMKLNEISELRKQNQSMVQAQDELPKAQLKISILESRLEDLTIQLKTKVEEEQELSVRNRSLQEMFNQEVKNRTRLSLHNEELQWKLKQNSEKYTTTLNELSKSYQDPSLLSDFKNSLYAPISEKSQESNDTLQLNSSPPSSPVIKGVVEKCDSVSYVLELNDDESAEVVASRVVKRAGSFRVNNFKERSPSFKRQYSLGGANALSQSASATSLSRQHSDSPVKTIGGIVKLQKTPRTRSYSLNASNEPKKTQRVPIDVANSDYTKWQQSMKTMSTSSPLASSRKYKNNGQPNGLLEIDDNNAGTMSSLITTDDVDLTKDFVPTQRNRTAPIPAQNSIKKRQQIKESAGEAMVSQQSEDDQSYGSDSTSTSSSSAASPLHSEASKHRHLSLDEEAFMNKIVASLSTRSTPMEVSWSEDGDNEPYAQESSA